MIEQLLLTSVQSGGPVEYISSSTGTSYEDSITLTIPSGARIGDLAMVAISARDAGTSWELAGWSVLYNEDAHVWSNFLFTVLTSLESVEFVDSEARAKHISGVLSVFRNTEVGGFALEDSPFGEPDPPNLTGITDSSCVLIVGHLDAGDITSCVPPTGYTMTDWVTEDHTTTMIAYKINPAAIEDPADFEPSDTDNWLAATIELTHKE